MENETQNKEINFASHVESLNDDAYFALLLMLKSSLMHKLLVNSSIF